MKKIATLTFQEADSYGAMLQAYALQKAIQLLGYETEILNYSCKAIVNSYRMSPTPKSVVARLCRTPFYQVRQSRFRKFRADRLVMSDKVAGDELGSFSARYDAVVVGSDQVWNPLLTAGDPTYFLTFLRPEQKKVSYAASIGLAEWRSNERDAYLPLLHSFDCLTVREKTASEYLSRYGVAAKVVCDPTLLLTQSDYIEIENDNRTSLPYVLLFCLEDPFGQSVSFARRIANAQGGRLVVMHNGKLPVPNAKNVRDAGPCEFLSLVHHASMVITESFHGICLSLMFRKPFFYFDPRAVNKTISRSSRITDLLSALDLSNRIATSEIRDYPPVNYSEVTAKLSAMRETSFEILKQSLE